MRSVVDMDATVSLILLLVDDSGGVNIFLKSIDVSLFSFNLFLELCKEKILLADNSCVDLKLLTESQELLFKHHLIAQQVVIVFLFVSELVLEIIVSGLDHLFVSKEFLDLSRFVAVKLVLETLVGNLFLCFSLSLKLFVLAFGEFLLLSQVVTLLRKPFGLLRKHCHLNFQELDLHLGILNLFLELCCLFKSILVISL